MEQNIRKQKKYIPWTGISVSLFCITLLILSQIDNPHSQQISSISENDEYQGLIQITNLSQNQAHQVVDNLLSIAQKMLDLSNNRQQMNLNKEIKHQHGVQYQKLKGLNMMIDPNIISLIQNLPQVQHLIFDILDRDGNKEVSEQELDKAIHEVYKHSENKSLIDAFSKELFQKVNEGKSFKFEQFKVYFNSFMMKLLNGNSNPFENTPPFEKEDIKGFVLYLASERRIWDKCLLTAFKILNSDKDQYVTIEEIGSFLVSINKETWQDAKPYVDSILGYMRVTGCATGDKFNLGQLITFGELIRPYMQSILDKYMH